MWCLSILIVWRMWRQACRSNVRCTRGNSSSAEQRCGKMATDCVAFSSTKWAHEQMFVVCCPPSHNGVLVFAHLMMAVLVYRGNCCFNFTPQKWKRVTCDEVRQPGYHNTRLAAWSFPNPQVVGWIPGPYDYVEVSLSNILNPQLRHQYSRCEWGNGVKHQR